MFLFCRWGRITFSWYLHPWSDVGLCAVSVGGSVGRYKRGTGGSPGWHGFNPAAVRADKRHHADGLYQNMFAARQPFRPICTVIPRAGQFAHLPYRWSCHTRRYIIRNRFSLLLLLMQLMKLRNIFLLGRLVWLVYIIGAAIGGRVSFTTNDEHDAMDGELVCR